MFFLSVFFCISTFADTGFYNYETKVEVPEPLYVDLVRGLHSHKGEWEVNTLLSQNQSPLSEKKWAPEVEWVIKEGTAVELEFPMVGNSLRSYKVALQQRTYQSPNKNNLQGLQFLYEADQDFESSELTAFYIVAHRFNHYFSAISISGFKTLLERDRGLTTLLNATLFYNYSDEVDLGLEVNSASAQYSEAFLQVMPQLHLAMRDGLKIQFGYGAQEIRDKWFPTSSLRLIKEFNKKKNCAWFSSFVA